MSVNKFKQMQETYDANNYLWKDQPIDMGGRTIHQVGYVEFALHPQHETSCDSEIQTKEDFKNKFRKQLGSLALMSLNNTDKEEALEYQC